MHGLGRYQSFKNPGLEDEPEPDVEPEVPPPRATFNPNFVNFEGEGCGNRNDANITARPVVGFTDDNEEAVILIPRFQAFLTTTSEQNREKFCNVRLRINFPCGFCTNITDSARLNGNIRLGSGVTGAVKRAYGNIRQSITNTTVGPVSSRSYFFADSFTIARNPSDAINNFVDFEYRARLRLSRNSNSATGELDNRLTVISILNQAPCNGTLLSIFLLSPRGKSAMLTG
ncbi:hypothetical protein B0T21DRAFT_427372 [Apiosordaria backusii]|uniref:Uncharacterized protein n=1 Tax=Apiosordaria backusii TaxID=314023 RepID=A0AA40AAM7_9PEZI|nr:hypothetical protein B0T21DRAFT_427372 [Apiosordaria backusii]